MKRTDRGWRVALAALLSLACAACGDGERPLDRVADGDAEVTGEGVLVVVVDGLRWDHTTLAGYDRNTTPFLEAFAVDGVTFRDAWSPAPSLAGAHVALLSGCDPSVARRPAPPGSDPGAGEPRMGDTWIVPAEVPLLGRPFLGAGWNTAAFVDAPVIAGLRGFDRGFRLFIEYGGDAEELDRTVGVFGVGRRFLTWLNGLALDDDWFAYVHMNDLERVWARRDPSPFARGVLEATADWRPRPDLAYFPPVGLDEPRFYSLPPSRSSRAHPVTLAEYELRYDRGIRALDASLARLVAHVEEFDRGDNVTIVIVGSFGMGLGEDGLFLQAGLVEEQDLHVPLVVRPSKRARERLGMSSIDWVSRPPGARRSRGNARLEMRDSLVSLVDLAPTLVELAGLEAPARFQGLSFCSELAAPSGPGSAARRAVFASSQGFDGRAIVTSGVHASSYGRTSTLLDSSQGGGAEQPSGAAGERIRVRARIETAPLSAGEQRTALYQDAMQRWQSLLLEERRWLHFGAGGADSDRLEEIRRMQSLGIGQP